MIEIPIDEIDVIFISYDEPMKDRYWSELLEVYPFAKRVDGVKGFDAAHKAAANLSETDRFITVDGDTTVQPEFFDMILRFDEDRYGKHVFSWAGTNEINGLVYGNGSLKCWPREEALIMETHEAATDDQAAIEFCWSLPYLSMKDSYSVTHPAPTPYHAFRAGFREGIKMALDQGKRVQDPKRLFQTIWHGNAHKLLGWASLGADHENGLWAMYGSRMAVDVLIAEDFEIAKIADYRWFEQWWANIQAGHYCESPDKTRVCEHSGFEWDPVVLAGQVDKLGDHIHNHTGKFIPRFTEQQSAFYKEIACYRERPTPRILFEE